MSTTTTDSIEITARAKAFSGDGVREHKFSVSEDGTVRVWDKIAGYYTTCHSMTPATQTRIRKIAADAK